MPSRRTLQPSADQRHGLILVSATPEQIDTESFERQRFDGPPPRARPSDRLEPWLLDSGPPLIAFADAAYQLGLPFQTAVSVVLERQLLGEFLASNGMATVVAEVFREGAKLRARARLVDGSGISHGVRERAAETVDCRSLVTAPALAISIALDPPTPVPKIEEAKDIAPNDSEPVVPEPRAEVAEAQPRAESPPAAPRARPTSRSLPLHASAGLFRGHPAPLPQRALGPTAGHSGHAQAKDRDVVGHPRFFVKVRAHRFGVQDASEAGLLPCFLQGDLAHSLAVLDAPFRDHPALAVFGRDQADLTGPDRNRGGLLNTLQGS